MFTQTKTCCSLLSPSVHLSTDLSLFPFSRETKNTNLSRHSVLERFCLLGEISLSLGDSKEQQTCDCWSKQMLNNWEINCLKRLFCAKPPPTNLISYSAACLPHSPNRVTGFSRSGIVKLVLSDGSTSP